MGRAGATGSAHLQQTATFSPDSEPVGYTETVKEKHPDDDGDDTRLLVCACYVLESLHSPLQLVDRELLKWLLVQTRPALDRRHRRDEMLDRRTQLSPINACTRRKPRASPQARVNTYSVAYATLMALLLYLTA